MRNVIKTSEFELVIRDIEDELVRDNGLSNGYKIPVDGIIAFDTPNAGKQFGRADAAATPFISMGAFWSEDNDYVGIDLYPGAIEAVSHLVETGRRHILYLAPDSDEDVPYEARMLAYREVTEAAGLKPCLVRTRDLSVSSAWRLVTEAMQMHPDIDAIFCHNDDMAFGAHRALSDRGCRIGPDVALVGCDGIEETEYLSPPITSIVQPVDEMCELAWEFLQNRLNDPTIPLQQRILKPRLVVRASSQQ